MQTATQKTRRKKDSEPAWLKAVSISGIFVEFLHRRRTPSTAKEKQPEDSWLWNRKGQEGNLESSFHFSHYIKPPLHSWLHPSARETTAQDRHAAGPGESLRHTLPGSLQTARYPNTCTGIINNTDKSPYFWHLPCRGRILISNRYFLPLYLQTE